MCKVVCRVLLFSKVLTDLLVGTADVVWPNSQHTLIFCLVFYSGWGK